MGYICNVMGGGGTVSVTQLCNMQLNPSLLVACFNMSQASFAPVFKLYVHSWGDFATNEVESGTESTSKRDIDLGLREPCTHIDFVKDLGFAPVLCSFYISHSWPCLGQYPIDTVSSCQRQKRRGGSWNQL